MLETKKHFFVPPSKLDSSTRTGSTTKVSALDLAFLTNAYGVFQVRVMGHRAYKQSGFKTTVATAESKRKKKRKRKIGIGAVFQRFQ